MTRPITPFKSTDPRVVGGPELDDLDEPELPPESGVCLCGNDPSEEEDIGGHCDSCGEALP